MLGWVDVAVVVLYLVLVLAIGLGARFFPGSSSSSSSSGGGGKDVAEYFLAGRNVAWWAVGMSLFSSNIGSEHFVGLAGSGAASGLAVAHFEINSAVFVLLLGWVFVPYYLSSKVFTMPEYLDKRFNKYCRSWLAAVCMVEYVIAKISVSLYAGAIIFKVVLGVSSQWVSAVCILVATALYTVIGGLRAVMYTEVLQTVILVAGAAILLVIGMVNVGGLSGLRQELPDYYFHMFRGADDPNFPWTGILLGYPINAMWYWCTDQVIVQRVLAADNIESARSGTILAGYLKLLPLFMLVMPGMIARVLFPQEMAEDSNTAYPLLVVKLMPVGLAGLVVAAMLAALMSSFASLFNSCSTIFMNDVYRKYRPQSSDKELVVAGRVATLAIMCCGLLWIPVVPHLSKHLYVYLQSVQGCLSPPIVVVFVFGIFSTFTNGQGAFACLVFGHVLGVLRLGLRLWFGTVDPGDSNWLMRLVVYSHFLHFIFFTFVCCVAVIFGVSWFTRKAGDALTKEQTKLVWNKDKEEDIVIEEENEQWEEKLAEEERRPLVATADAAQAKIRGGQWQRWFREHRREVKVGLSVLLVVCVYSVEFIFR